MLILFSWVGTDVIRGAESAEKAMETIALDGTSLPDLPDIHEVAGPFVGVHRGGLSVAGGAIFPTPDKGSSETWRAKIDVLVLSAGVWRWPEGGELVRLIGYGASVSTPMEMVCIGGNDAFGTFQLANGPAISIRRKNLALKR